MGQGEYDQERRSSAETLARHAERAFDAVESMRRERNRYYNIVVGLTIFAATAALEPGFFQAVRGILLFASRGAAGGTTDAGASTNNDAIGPAFWVFEGVLAVLVLYSCLAYTHRALRHREYKAYYRAAGDMARTAMEQSSPGLNLDALFRPPWDGARGQALTRLVARGMRLFATIAILFLLCVLVTRYVKGFALSGSDIGMPPEVWLGAIVTSLAASIGVLWKGVGVRQVMDADARRGAAQ